jgi:hypothetical protein
MIRIRLSGHGAVAIIPSEVGRHRVEDSRARKAEERTPPAQHEWFADTPPANPYFLQAYRTWIR